MGDVIQQQRESIMLACAALFPAGQVTELRILEVDMGRGRQKGNAAGWFNDHVRLAEAAIGYDVRIPNGPAGIYITINPVNEACLARSANKVRDFQKVTTSDRDIVRRYWLPIDVDPVRPAGVSSSNEELIAARDIARNLGNWLEQECGWSPGLRALSGNGVHLLYRIDLPNTKESQELVARCLNALDHRFSSDKAKIDTTMHNAARILKLYGTMARKGDAIDIRPHRRSKLLQTNGKFLTFAETIPVPIEKLEALAKLAPGRSDSATPAKKKRQPAAEPSPKTMQLDGDHAVDLPKCIADWGLQVIREETFDGTGRKWILQSCIFDSSHTGTSAALGYSKSGAVFYKCHHDSCINNNWAQVKEKLGKPPLTDAGKAAAKVAVKAASKKDDADDEDPWELAREMLDEEFTDPDTSQVAIRRHRESFYRYDENRRCYRQLHDDDIRVMVTRWLGDRMDKATNRKVGDVINCLRALVTAPADLELPFVCAVNAETSSVTSDPQRRHWVTLKNGILDVDEVLTSGRTFAECLKPHDRNWLSLVALPFNYPITDRELQCPRWLKFLEEIFQGDESRIAILQEAFGSCFLLRMNLETFFIMEGNGSNGKSTVLLALETLLDKENTSSLDIEQLSDKYMVGELYGKLANLSLDMNEAEGQEGVLKKIVSGEPISADRKYKSALRFRPKCKLFFATNKLPRFNDPTIGIWRRMIVIPFDYTIPDDKKDTMFFDNKLAPELPAIFVWALQGMIRLHERGGRFTQSDRCTIAARTHRLNCLPVMTFVEECADVRPGLTVQADELYRSYTRWCKWSGLSKPKPLHVFTREIVNFYDGVKMANSRSEYIGRRIIEGIGIRGNLPFGDVQVPPDAPDYWNH